MKLNEQQFNEAIEYLEEDALSVRNFKIVSSYD